MLTLVTGTADVPLFHKVTRTGVGEADPTPVVGNTRLPHVMTKGDGVTADGVVVELLQPVARIAQRNAPAARGRNRFTSTAS